MWFAGSCAHPCVKPGRSRMPAGNKKGRGFALCLSRCASGLIVAVNSHRGTKKIEGRSAKRSAARDNCPNGSAKGSDHLHTKATVRWHRCDCQAHPGPGWRDHPRHPFRASPPSGSRSGSGNWLRYLSVRNPRDPVTNQASNLARSTIDDGRGR